MRNFIDKYIETEGFLSTTMKENLANSFATTGKMIIEVPLKNLRGMFDNGFAKIMVFSENPREREVLFNAFNTFKIISVR